MVKTHIKLTADAVDIGLPMPAKKHQPKNARG